MNTNGNDPLWYKDAIIYETHVRAFFDSNGDGKGDFPGLTAKLNYLQDLGVTAIWLLPFYPSPWRDDGYDTSDYTGIHPAYGTLRDFQNFLREAQRRGLRVITELILNHTSDQHAWFQRARHAKKGSRQRNFYVWSDSPAKYSGTRVIFKDFQNSNWTWNPVANAYYWHRFYAHQPDLNFDHPLVRRAIFRAVDFWLDQGVDGFRLDAVPYLFEREGTNCENLPETHAFLKELRTHIDSKYQGRVLLAEANLWPEEAVAYVAPDECQMAFHFPLMPRLFTAIRMEDRFPIMEILRQTPAIAASSQWALFLRNHDELTLEMVTDEERDYMYRFYAQDPQTRINLGIRRRLAPLLGNDRRKIELMNGLLFSLPGTPVMYYGDEIGMGDNVYLGDRDGVRTPMQWSMDRNAGFSSANPQQLYLPINIDPEYHYESVNVEIQQNNSHSLLWWMKRLLTVRKRQRAFGRGTLAFLHPDNHRVLAYHRKYEDEQLLVVANLSRFVQAVELDLEHYRGLTPVELFGRSELPAIGEGLYPLTLGPYAFYWLSLEDRRSSIEALPGAPFTIPELAVSSWAAAFDKQMVAALSHTLHRFLKTRHWFKDRQRQVESITISDIIPLRPAAASILLTNVRYANGDAEDYSLFASVSTGEESLYIQAQHPEAIAARLTDGDGRQGILYSALWDRHFVEVLLKALTMRRRFKGDAGDLTAQSFRPIREPLNFPNSSSIYNPGQTNSCFSFGQQFFLKLFRRIEPGPHPEAEAGQYLLEHTNFKNIAPIAGRLSYFPANGGEPIVLGVVHRFVAHEANAWQYTMDALARYFERTQTFRNPTGDPLFGAGRMSPCALSKVEPPGELLDLFGEYLERIRLLGQRTAELHLALAGNGGNQEFAPETISDSYRQSMYHRILAIAMSAQQARRDLGQQDAIRTHLRQLRESKAGGMRIRVHGNYTLHEVLYTGCDFVIIDFEGDTSRSLTARRNKNPALADVASMITSFHTAAYAEGLGQMPGVSHGSSATACLLSWADCWFRWVSAAFMRGYLTAAAGDRLLLPETPMERETMLDALCLERFFTQVNDLTNHTPQSQQIPITGIRRIVESWDEETL